jgi:uncharacterized protein (TIGR02246 family)
MRTEASTVLGLAAMLVLACAPPAETVDTAAEVAAIEAVRAQEVAAIVSGDTVVAHLTDDAVMLPPGGPRVDGKAAIRAWLREFMAAATVQSLEYTEAHVTVAGDWAIEQYAGRLGLVPAGGEAMSETLKGIHVYRKGADGSWRIAMDVWNMDTAPPGM